MARIVEWSPVHEDKILINASSADAETGRSLAWGLHPRHHLDYPDDIGLPHQSRDLLDHFSTDRLFPELRDRKLLSLTGRKDLGRLKDFMVFFKSKVVFK